MSYERRHEAVLSRAAFLWRVARHAVAAGGVILVGLGVGTLGYRGFTGLPWTDAFLNAAMILTGMGPVDRMETQGAKVFAACYALFSGLVFAAAAGVVVSPFLHRVLHRFHASERATDS